MPRTLDLDPRAAAPMRFTSFADFDDTLSARLVPHVRRTDAPETFRAEVTHAQLGEVSTGTVRASSYSIEITPESLSRAEAPEYVGLVLCQSGAYQFSGGRRTGLLAPGDMAVTDPRSPSVTTCKGPAFTAVMTIPVATWCAVAPPPPIDIFAVLRGETLPARLARLMALELIGRGIAAAPLQSDLVIRQIVELLDLALAEGRDTLPDTLNRVMRLRAIKAHILARMDDPELGLQSVADHFNISPRYVSDLFQGDGQTMMDYLWDIRLNRAADLLRRHGRTIQIKDVVHRTGFKSPSYFSSRFADRYGVTPNAFRKDLRTLP